MGKMTPPMHDAEENSVDQAMQYKAFAIILGIALVSFEVLFLSQRFDAYQLVQHSDGLGWRSVFGYMGQGAKLAVVFIFLLGVAIHGKLSAYWGRLLSELAWPRFCFGLVAQAFVYSGIYYLSSVIFTVDDLSAVSSAVLGAWLLGIVIWSLLVAYAFVPFTRVGRFLQLEKQVLIMVLVLAFFVWWVAQLGTHFWGPLSSYTFALASIFLALIDPSLVYIDAEAKNLGFGEFVVNIAPACSGIEGIGLVCSFTALYLYLHRNEFKFPHALVLFPLGALFIWLLNVVRIAVLILIGEFGSPEVAVGGFHSQAGWITFILASLVMLWAAGSISFIAKPVNDEAEPPVRQTESADELPVEDTDRSIATLVPMVALLATILLTQAISSGFDWLYPLRVVVVVGALCWAWPKLSMTKPRSNGIRNSIEALAIGVLVAVLWTVLLAGKSPEANALISSTLGENAFWLAGAWLLFRFLGTAITVPIAEELAFRGYLLCKLSKSNVSLDGPIPLSVIAVTVSSLAFGFLHGTWLEGALAGVLYALLRLRTQHIFYAILAHGITNALLFLYAFMTGEWALL